MTRSPAELPVPHRADYAGTHHDGDRHAREASGLAHAPAGRRPVSGRGSAQPGRAGPACRQPPGHHNRIPISISAPTLTTMTEAERDRVIAALARLLTDIATTHATGQPDAGRPP